MQAAVVHLLLDEAGNLGHALWLVHLEKLREFSHHRLGGQGRARPNWRCGWRRGHDDITFFRKLRV